MYSELDSDLMINSSPRSKCNRKTTYKSIMLFLQVIQVMSIVTLTVLLCIYGDKIHSYIVKTINETVNNLNTAKNTIIFDANI